MKIIKDIFIKIGNGFLTGIGFSIAFILFSTVMFHFMDNFFFNDYENTYEEGECYNLKSCDQEHGLSVSIISEDINSQQFLLLGEVINDGDKDWSSIDIKAELFDENNVFIEECKHYVNEKVTAGSKVNFKLNCSQCSTIQLEKYASYQVKITDASYY